LPGRTWQGGEYRFGFNSIESDNEIKGTGNAYDFGARIYDSRLGRWLSLDPLSTKYPDLSPYSYCANNSILFIDPNGKEIIIGSIVYIPPLSRTAEDVKKIAESSSFSQQTFEALDYIYQQAQNAKVSKIDDLVSSSIKVTIEESADFGYESNITGVRFSDGTPSSPGGVRGEAAKDHQFLLSLIPNKG
jgi:RHS repeat-associated protein